MVITALPDSAVRILGSAQVLTSPVSLVKELIDNALDARSSSIDVTVDSSTLRKIEVRDNGHGIAMDDLNVLGRRGHTSKLRSLDELRVVGSSSLGFRGEALASAVELGEVNVTTKTDGQTIATTVKLQPKGGVASQKPISHPIGTTICVSNFLEKLVVRKKRALVDSSKTLAKIKELLQAYALARLTVRFSLKVIQADVRTKMTRASRNDWNFVPRQKGSIKEAVTQVAGKDVAAECIETSMTFPFGETSQESDSHDFNIEAFLVRPDANLSKTSKGQYLSIDSRPLNCSRGTMKKIVTLYKSYLRSSMSKTNNFATQIKDPFLRLSITCRPGAYDPNVEPAKDDILFENEEYFIECIERLFTAVYGELQISDISSKKLSVHQDAGFEMLLARRTESTEALKESDVTTLVHAPHQNTKISALSGNNPDSDMNHIGEDAHVDISMVEQSNANSDEVLDNLRVQKGHFWGFSMANDFDNTSNIAPAPMSEPGLSSPEAEESEQANGLCHLSSLNPWVIAKLNSSTRDISTRNVRSAPSRQPINENSSPIIQRKESSLNVTPHRSSEPLALSEAAMVQTSQHHGDFVRARDVPLGRPWSPPPTLESRPKRHQGISKPFVPPLRNKGNENQTPEAPLQQMTPTNDDPSSPRYSIPVTPPHSRPTLHQTTLDADLQSSLAFEHRKTEATRARRLENRAAHKAAQALQSTSTLPRSSPHQNRYYAATAALDSISASNGNLKIAAKVNIEPLHTSLPDGDPRAYLMRRQRSLQLQGRPGSVLKVKRAKSTLLPLEKVPIRQMVQNVELEVMADAEEIGAQMKILSVTDGYTREGVLGKGLRVDEEEMDEIREKLEGVVRVWSGKTFESMDVQVEYNLSGLRQCDLLV